MLLTACVRIYNIDQSNQFFPVFVSPFSRRTPPTGPTGPTGSPGRAMSSGVTMSVGPTQSPGPTHSPRRTQSPGPAGSPGRRSPDDYWKKRCAQLETDLQQLQTQLKELRTQRTSAIIAESENTLLKSQIQKLEETIARLRSPEGHPIFLFSWISSKDFLVSHFTGLPNEETFRALLNLFEGKELNYIKGWNVTRFLQTEQLFMTLLKLRRGLSFNDLALRYGVDASTVSNIFRTWLLALHEVIFKRLMKKVPSRLQNQKHLPSEFEKNYENTRMVIDCTEISAARPSLIKRQNELFSPYKHRITLKGLVGIAPHGVVTFASKLYPGRTSDKEIVAHSGILDIFVEGDFIMADKGFLIQSLLPPGVTLNIPPFSATPQFTPEEIEETTSIAKSRIHVERAIQRIKLFKILDFIPHDLMPYASEIFQVCAALANFRKPLIQDTFEDLEVE